MDTATRRSLLASIVVFGLAVPARADDRPSLDVEVRFTDASAVRMVLLQDTLEIVTRYGTLTVPTADIRRVEFGVHLTDDVERRIADAVRRLGNDAAGDRDEAIKHLVKLGHQAYPALQRAQQNPDPEVARRAEEAMTRIRAVVAADLLRPRVNDRIETTQFLVVGRIVSPTVKLRSAYFGVREVRITDLVSIRFLAGGGTFEVNIDAAKYANSQQWLETDIEVYEGTRLVIAATGQVDLMQDGTGQYVSGPGGYKGQAMPWANGAAAGGKAPGTLLGRIGETGDSFVIGEHYKGKASRDGKLFLQIVASPWGNGPAGSYHVRASVGEGR
jgi:hypothetical protein